MEALAALNERGHGAGGAGAATANVSEFKACHRFLQLVPGTAEPQETQGFSDGDVSPFFEAQLTRTRVPHLGVESICTCAFTSAARSNMPANPKCLPVASRAKSNCSSG